MKAGMPKLHNRFYLQLIDTTTDKVKQEAFAENVMLTQFYKRANPAANRFFSYIHFGSGTTEPTAADTTLESPLFSKGIANKNGDYGYLEVVDEDTLKIINIAIVPASSSYVGTITEIGLGYERVDQLCNRALLKDAEGNLISIVKTDTDQLTVRLELYITRDHNSVVKWDVGNNCFINTSGILPSLWHPTLSSYAISYSNLDKYARRRAVTYSDNYSNNVTFYSDNRAKVANPRVGSGAANGHYIHSLNYYSGGDGCLFYLPFPNEALGPFQLSNISVGVGDGNTTEFDPPLGLWIKDTDKIYINGVEQVRGVDYTIDHKANRQRLHEITPGNFIKDFKSGSKSYVNRPTWSNIPFTEAAIKMEFNKHVTFGMDVPILTNDKPLYFELNEDPQVGLEVNYWIPGYWYKTNSSVNSGSPAGYKLTLSYSIDGQEYIDVDTYTLVANSETSDNTKPRSFDKVSAKYWKLTCTNISSGNILHHGGSDNFGNSYTSYTLAYLGYYGEPIKFTNPPADGAVITMDCQLDRPYKNENFVIDFTPEFQF